MGEDQRNPSCGNQFRNLITLLIFYHMTIRLERAFVECVCVCVCGCFSWRVVKLNQFQKRLGPVNFQQYTIEVEYFINTTRNTRYYLPYISFTSISTPPFSLIKQNALQSIRYSFFPVDTTATFDALVLLWMFGFHGWSIFSCLVHYDIPFHRLISFG